MGMLPIMAYMMVKGIRFDFEKAKEMRAEVAERLAELQTQIDQQAGMPDGKSLNIGSNKQMVETLYGRLGMEPVFKIERGRKTNKKTCDQKALLRLMRDYNSDLIYAILQKRHWEERRKQVADDPDSDGRLRGNYNVVGTVTGRLSCQKSNTGRGAALQGIMKVNRKLYLADEGYHWFQCDLEGADNWTVAAHCADLGDPRMLDDLKNEIKPAKVVVLMLKVDPDYANATPAELKAGLAEHEPLLRESGEWDWLYFACKRVAHATNYMGGIRTLVQTMASDSWKMFGNPVYVSESEARNLQGFYLRRYGGVKAYQARIERRLKRERKLVACSGNVHHFFGRLSDNATLNSACSFEPQANTTYITNVAARRLWMDPDNRDGRKLIIQPLHQVHDAICGQFPIAKTDWSTGKIREYFDIPVTIANQKFVIPFEGEYGRSWGEMNQGLI